MAASRPPRRVFLLSPASLAGERARILLRPEGSFDLARRLRAPEGAPLGEAFTFLSGLYFRGKLAYAQAFARPPRGVAGALVITAGRGLLPPGTRVTAAELRALAGIPVDAADPRYREPLARDAARLAARAARCEVVLLGSVATGKYLEVLGEIFGPRLLFPAAFVGRGDMSRGGLLLRAVDAGEELAYVPALGAVVHGPRPPRLPPRRPR